METLYRQINALAITDDFREFLDELHLSEGYKFMAGVTKDNTEQVMLAKYVSKIYDPESKVIEVHKVIDELKLKVITDLGLTMDGVFKACVENKNEDFNRYVSWYYSQIKDFDFEAIRTGQELISEQFEVARTRIEKGKDGIGMDDDRYLRAMNLKNTCYMNAVDNITKIEALKLKMQMKFEATDELVEKERLAHTGNAEQEALWLKQRKKK